MKISAFDWDSGNWPKCGKHGVSQKEVEALFEQPHKILPDLKHSEEEERFLAFGQSKTGRWTAVYFTLRLKNSRNMLRPISARYMHQKEVEKYAK